MESPEILASVRALLATAPEDVVCAYLFGSQARGTARHESDVDVAILLRTPPARTLEGQVPPLGAELERALGRCVDLVLLNDAPPDLTHRILRDGNLVLDRDRAARIRFEVKARNEYFDLLPVIRQYRSRALAAAARWRVSGTSWFMDTRT
jgi:predicted nucleotidyltransferase